MSSADGSVVLRLGADPTGLTSGLRRASAQVNTFGGRATAVMGRVNAALKTSADRALTPLTGILLGGGLGAAGKVYGDLSEQLMYYGFVAKKSKKEIGELRAEIHSMAIQTGVDQETILGGINKIAEITGDTKFAESMAEMLAKTSKATGASMSDLATIASTMRTQWKWTEGAIAEAFNTLIVQGDSGSYTLDKMAVEGKALFSAANAFGIRSKTQFESFGAFLQILNASIKSEAELTTAINGLMNELIVKAPKLKKMGVKVFDKKDGKTQVRDFETIIMELMSKTKGDISIIAPLFGMESQAALKPIMDEYRQGWVNYKKIRDAAIGSGTSEIEIRYTATAEDPNTNVNKFKAAVRAFTDTKLAGPIERLISVLKYLTDHETVFTGIFYTLASAAGVLAAVKFGGMVKGAGGFAKDLFSATRATPGASKGLGGAVAGLGVQQVYVINWHEMGRTQGMTGYADPTRGPAGGVRGLGDAATKATGKLTAFRGGVNAFLKTDFGSGLLAGGVVFATAQIIEAGKALYDLKKAQHDAKEVNETSMAAMDKIFIERYGLHAAKISRQIDKVNLDLMGEKPGTIRGDYLLRQRSALTDKLMRQIEFQKNASARTKNPEINQDIKIYVDPARQTAVAEVDSSAAAGSMRVSTMPWMNRSIQ